jgi:aerobic carbon-monoxide dehydrogenase medium subunit
VGQDMKAALFDLHQPGTLDDALDLLAEHGDGAKALAGGQSLVPMLALRLARFENLIDLNEIDDLTGIDRVDGELRLGAMTRHRSVERDPTVGALVPLLARATKRVGHWQIRNRGTLGGSVAHADPAAEQPAVCLALDAIMEVGSRRGRRQIAATDFFQGTWATALDADELLLALRFPVWERPCGFGIEELARRNGDFALAGVVCGVGLDGERSRVEKAAISLFGVGTTPVRAFEAEAALLAGAPSEDVARACTAAIDPSDDLHASGAYRRRVAGVLVKRAITSALEEARRD